MKNKTLVICKSILWCLLMLLFPVLSGTISVIFSLDTVTTLFLQGVFMAMALILSAVFVLNGKWRWREIGFARTNIRNCKRVFYFIPLLVIFIPVAVKGFYIKSIGYVLGSLFLYLFVGIAEEVYFRGIIPRYLKEEFSTPGLMIVSTFIFGWLAIEMTILVSNIIPAILLHFLFGFETKIVVLSGGELLIAESARGALMFIIAGCFAFVIYKQKETL